VNFVRQDYQLGPFIDEHYALLRYVLTLHPDGIALEFGVGRGGSLRTIAEHMPVIGFDSFEGLPEDWRDEFKRGHFKCTPPRNIPGAVLRIGLFADTLPTFEFDVYSIGLVHIDCDLYSSTATVLKYLGPHLRSGCYVVFDEWHGFDNAEAHEQRAWREFADDTGIGWTVVGHSNQQWGIRIA
jgi:hypothetical protein